MSISMKHLRALFGFFLAAGAPLVHADSCQISMPPSLVLPAGHQEPLVSSGNITRVAVGAPAIADIGVLDDRNLLLQAKQVGKTSLLIWSSCRKTPHRIDVSVIPASDASQALLSPGVTAKLPLPVQEERFKNLPAQVQADIRFVEVSRSKLQDVGTRLQLRSGSGRSNFFGSSALTGTGVLPGQVIPGVATPLDSSNFNIVWGGSSSRFLSVINLLEQTGHAYTLSRPSLVALSGQTANFLAGGEVPIPVPQGQNGAVGIEYKEFGVRLTISPTVLDADQIVLKVSPEVSELDFVNAVSISGSLVPALRIRRTDTSISLADGESFIISGLISQSTIGNVEKLPGLGNLPVLGAFFRSTRFEREDRELLMIVTPRLVRPLRANAQLPALPGSRWQGYQPATGTLFWQGIQAPDSSRKAQ